MYTANTMASAIEAMGMSLPFSSSTRPVDPSKRDECSRRQAILHLLEADIKPRDIMTREAFENAMVVLMVLGGSTNAVLHLIAMARAVDVPLAIDDFQRVSDRVPLLADLKPSGTYVQEDLHGVGGIPAVMKYLLGEGLLTGDCLTVTGRTVAENLGDVAGLSRDRTCRALEDPINPTGHIQILRGNLAPDGAVAKITGKEGAAFSGPANVFDSEEAMLTALEAGADRQGRCGRDPLRGPQGRPRHAGDADPHLGHHGRRSGQRCRADHRRSLLGRLPRLHRRAHHARSPGGRPHCAGQRRRRHHHRRRDQGADRRRQ